MRDPKPSITVRDVCSKDHRPIIDLIDQTWNYRDYGLSEAYCYRKALRDLYSSLAESDFSKVILVNEQVVGFIFANTGKFNNTAKKSHYLEKIRKLEEGNEKSPEGVLINKYASLFKYKNTQLLQKEPKKYEAELVYFAIDKKFRGFGLGKRLFRELVGYLFLKSVNSLYLFTDSTCNFDFYKRYGFVQKAQTTGYADLRDETLQFYLFALEDLSSFDPD